ncbi:MAG: hypothetical protein ACKO6N_20570 [Myxococcota bacterium]
MRRRGGFPSAVLILICTVDQVEYEAVAHVLVSATSLTLLTTLLFLGLLSSQPVARFVPAFGIVL